MALMAKEILGLQLERLRIPAVREFLHSVEEAILSTSVVTVSMPEQYARWKVVFDEMNRVYEISLKSEDSELIHNLDDRRDNMMTGIKAIANNFRKAMDDDTRSKGTAVWDALGSFRVDIEAQYNIQTAQFDSLLGVLLGDQLRPSVEALGMLPIVEELKSLNDRLHELVGQRDLENIGKPDGQRQEAMTAAITAYRMLAKYVNAWYLLNVEAGGETVQQIGLFIDLVNSIILRYRRSFPNASGNSNASAGDGEENSTEGEEADGEEQKPGSDDNTNPGTGTGKKYTVTTYDYAGDVIDSWEVEVGQPIVLPTPPAGFGWNPCPSVMPDRNVNVTCYDLATGMKEL